MFALAISMLLSDQVLGSDNWLAAAPDPRPDQMPTPVSSTDSSVPAHIQLIITCLCVLLFLFQTYTPNSRTTYVGILMNKRAVLCKALFFEVFQLLLICVTDCTQEFHYLANRKACISGLVR
jgi:hypothetical protein